MYITEKIQNVIITQLYISQQSMIVIAKKKNMIVKICIEYSKNDSEDLH